MHSQKIAIFSNSFSSTFVFRKSLVEKLSHSGSLSCIVSSGNDLQYAICPVNEHYLVKMRLTALKFFPSVYNVARRIRRDDVTCIHGFTHLGNLLAFLVWLFSSCGLVLTVTGMGRAFSTDRWDNFLVRAPILLFYYVAQIGVDSVIVQNADDEELFRKIFIKKMHRKILRTNGSGIALDYFAGVLTDKGRGERTEVGFFSRALPEKGVESFYRLAADFHGSRDVVFHHWGVAGSGKFSEGSIGEYAARHNVIYHGHTVDAKSSLAVMDIVVIPSFYREGMSRLCIEAMLAGKVVVARSTSGVRDHIINGANGFIYTGDENLGVAFRSVLQSDFLTVGCSAASYAKQAFSAEMVDAVYFQAYAKCG